MTSHFEGGAFPLGHSSLRDVCPLPCAGGSVAWGEHQRERRRQESNLHGRTRRASNTLPYHSATPPEGWCVRRGGMHMACPADEAGFEPAHPWVTSGFQPGTFPLSHSSIVTDAFTPNSGVRFMSGVVSRAERTGSCVALGAFSARSAYSSGETRSMRRGSAGWLGRGRRGGP